MEITNIEIDKKYKYKEICILLEEEAKSGKSKILQLRNWERYLKLEKKKKTS